MQGIFTVYRKNTIHYDRERGDFFGKPVEVFAVRDDKNGYPHFLIHNNNEWKYESAKYFTPNPREKNDIYYCSSRSSRE